MQNRLGIFILAIIALPIVFWGCSKTSSTDTPLPSSYNASIYIGGDNGIVYAIDPVSGLKNWEFNCCAAKIIASPLVYNEMVYVGTAGNLLGEDTLYKLNAQTGALVKKFAPLSAGIKIIATPIADGSLLYVACTNNLLYALDTGSLAIIWSYPTSGAIRSSPVVYNGYVYFGCDDGNIYCVDKTAGPTGTYNWTWNTAGIHPYSVIWNSSPAIGLGYGTAGQQDTVLCIGGSDSSIYCIQLLGSTHGPSLSWVHHTTGGVNSSPTLYGGACIVGCDDFNVYCVDIGGNYERWKFATNSTVYSSPYAYRNTIYVGSNDYYLYAINFLNGTQKWSFRTAGVVKSSPLLYGACIYVGSNDKNLYAIDTALGQKKWSFFVNNIIECSPAVDNNIGGFGTNSSQSGLVN